MENQLENTILLKNLNDLITIIDEAPHLKEVLTNIYMDYTRLLLKHSEDALFSGNEIFSNLDCLHLVIQSLDETKPLIAAKAEIIAA